MNHKINIIVLIIVVFLICSCIKNKEDNEDKHLLIEGIGKIQEAFILGTIVIIISFLLIIAFFVFIAKLFM